jgi:short-subunit dehydrogenase
MTRTNLEAPMILSAKLLRPLRENRGMIINIASVTALAPSPHGAAYGALKAGLLHFSRTLFEENRKFGVRVTTVMPDMTDTNLYRNADFEADPSEGASLTAKQVADAVLQVISQPEGSVISELVLKPQYHRIRRRH